MENGNRGYVCVTGVHGVMEAQKDARFRDILNNAFLCTPDGMPMVWMGWLNKYQIMDRVYGPDLMLEICQMSVPKNYTHFLYGGAEGVAPRLKAKLEERFPGIQIVGTYTPPFRPLNSREEKELVEMVQACQPDFFWVGLSTPKQEKFMARYLSRLPTKLMLGVGAAFDFHIGKVSQAPRWMQRAGLEWAYRLKEEPRRLWKRYLYNNPVFLFKIAGQLFGINNPKKHFINTQKKGNKL